MAENTSTSAPFGGMVFTERTSEIVKPEFFDPAQVAEESIRTFELLGAKPESDPAGEKSPLDIRIEEMKALHESLAADYPDGDLEVIAFRPVSIDPKVLTLRNLFLRFNQGDKAATEDRAFWLLLNQYDAEELNSRTVKGVPAFALGQQALALIVGNDTGGDDRLHYTGQTGKEQADLQEPAQRTTLEHETRQTRELSTSIPDNIVLAARALVRGESLPNQDTWDRKAHMGTNKVVGVSYFPLVISFGSALELNGIHVHGSDTVGVSRSVGQKQAPQA